jgi:hypothetical protein
MFPKLIGHPTNDLMSFFLAHAINSHWVGNPIANTQAVGWPEVFQLAKVDPFDIEVHLPHWLISGYSIDG